MFCFIIHETIFEDNTSMAKNTEVIEKVLNHQIQIIVPLQLHQLHLSHRWLRSQKQYQTNVLNHQN